MTRCDWAGAGVVLAFWAAGFALDYAFARQLGELGGFVILVVGLVGIAAGQQARQHCRAKTS